MRVRIEFDLDVDGMDKDYVDDLLDDYTHEMRTSKFLVPGSWQIFYDTDQPKYRVLEETEHRVLIEVFSKRYGTHQYWIPKKPIEWPSK